MILFHQSHHKTGFVARPSFTYSFFRESVVDLGRIQLPFSGCKPDVIALYHRPRLSAEDTGLEPATLYGHSASNGAAFHSPIFQELPICQRLYDVPLAKELRGK